MEVFFHSDVATLARSVDVLRVFATLPTVWRWWLPTWRCPLNRVQRERQTGPYTLTPGEQQVNGDYRSRTEQQSGEVFTQLASGCSQA